MKLGLTCNMEIPPPDSQCCCESSLMLGLAFEKHSVYDR